MSDSILMNSAAFIEAGALFTSEISILNIPKNTDDLRAFYSLDFDPNTFSFLMIAAKKSSFLYRDYYSDGSYGQGQYSLNRDEMIITTDTNMSQEIIHNSSGNADIFITVDFQNGLLQLLAHRGYWDSSDTYGWEFQADVELYICLK